MKNKTTITNNPIRQDPVLEVEKWKDKTDQKIKKMNFKELERYYLQALRLVASN